MEVSKEMFTLWMNFCDRTIKEIESVTKIPNLTLSQEQKAHLYTAMGRLEGMKQFFEILKKYN